MSDTEDILAIEDPSDLTVVQLKKILSANNVQLPMKNEKKQVYVDLANQLKASKLKASKKRNEPEDQSESKTTPKKAKTDKKTDSAKKRRKSNPFQSGGESPDEEEEEEKPKKRTSTKPKSEESTTPTRTTRSAVPDSEKKDLNNSINNNNNNATVAIATVVDTVVATTTPTRRSIREETKTEVTTVAPVSPSRTRRSARLSEVPQPSAPVTPTRRSRVSAALTTSENSIASSTVIPEPESGTRRRRYSEGRATETPSISTDGTDWRARREERRKARETGTTPPRGEEGPKYSVPMTSAEDAAKFLGTSPIKPPVAPVTSTEPGALVTDENESIGNWISTILVGVLLALLAGAAIYFFVIPFLPKPFCDSGAEITENCIPCPEHGTCGNGTLSCDVGYIRYGAQCIPDKNIDKNAQKILAEIEEILARQHGYHECLYTETPYIPEDILYGMVFAKGIVSDEQEFELAWDKMNNELLKTSTTITRSQQREYASSEIKKPLSCKVKEFAAANVLQISAFVAILFGIWYFISLRREREEEKLLAVQLADQAKHRLHEQQVQSRLSSTSGVTVEPYIAVLHLRDELTDTMSKKKRDRVWREVEAAIHSDARVQETSLLFHGEQQTMWEWTGPVKLPSDIFSPGRTPTRGNVEDYIRPAVFDEGSSSALDHKYPGLFAPRQFQ